MNPWWRAAATDGDPTLWTSQDRSLRERARYDLGYRATTLDDIATAPVGNGLYVVRGPRRVGKSVALKDLIAALCSRHDLSPWQVIYAPGDTFTTRELRRTVALGTDLTRAAPDARRVWVFDEITSIVGWTSEVKSLRDNSNFGEQTVVLTGSSAAYAEEAVRDLGAGRTGGARTPFRLLLPMSFRDHLASIGTDVPLPPVTDPADLQSADAAEAIRTLEPFTEDLDLAWQRYLEAGGFPRAVTEHHREGMTSAEFLTDLAAWLSADIDPAAPRDSVPLLIAELHSRGSSPLNIRDTANRLGLGRDALTSRLNRLVATFAAIWCPQVGDSGRRVAGAQAKLYLADPILAWLGSRLRPGLSQPDFSTLSEAALGTAVARALDAASPGRLTNADTIGYVRTGAGNEVDLAPVPVASPCGDRWTVPVESKWVPSGWRSESRVLEAKYGRGVLATKNITDLSSSVWAVPAPVLALLLG